MTSPRSAIASLPTVFLVEDSVTTRTAMRAHLEEGNCGRVVGEAYTAMGAIAAIRLAQPEVVLLDLLLREGTGLEVLVALRTALPATRFIVLSTYWDNQVAERCRQFGADEVIAKSQSLAQLDAKLAEFARTPRSRSEETR
jgi:two-component system, NarL family, response regulator DevR